MHAWFWPVQKKTPKNHEAHSGESPITNQTEGSGCGFTRKVLRVETQQPGSSRPTSRLKRSSSGVRWMCRASFTLNSPDLLALSITLISCHRIGWCFFHACSATADLSPLLANSLLQPSCRFSYVHLPATTRNTIYYTRNGNLTLTLESCALKITPDLKGNWHAKIFFLLLPFSSRSRCLSTQEKISKFQTK